MEPKMTPVNAVVVTATVAVVGVAAVVGAVINSQLQVVANSKRQ